jgi:hypothetical protein
MTRTRCAASLLALLAASSGLTACSADDPAVCDDVDALSASMSHLRDAQIGENALSVVSTELSQMTTEVKQLADDASEQYAKEIDAVRTQVNALESGVRSATQQPTAAALAQVSDGIKGVGTAVDNLVDSVQGTC